MHTLNPTFKLLTTMVVLFALVFANRPLQALILFCVPVVLALTIAGMSVIAVLKRFVPFMAFFFAYVVVQAGYSVTTDPVVYHVLWLHFSKTGMVNGFTLGLRMLASVAYGILFITTTDFTDLVVSLCQDAKVPPKFAYGVLAGIRFVPLFRDEWRKLRSARQLRGRDSRWSVTRVVTYALPLLSQAIRTSERVAIAMEARGFTGGARTYYRNVERGIRDIVFAVGLLTVNVAVLVVLARS